MAWGPAKGLCPGVFLGLCGQYGVLGVNQDPCVE